MELINLRSKNYPGDPTRYFNFKRFFNDSSKNDWILIPGLVDFSRLDKKQGKKYLYLEFEEPNRFFSSDPLFNHINYENLFDKVLTICPYTAAWLNKKYNNQKRTPVFFPFNDRYTPKITEKKYDVIYTGNLLSDTIIELAKSISKFNYRLVSGSNHELVTNKNVSYVEKIKLLSSSRITIVQNLLYLTKDHVRSVHKVEGWQDNEAYQCLPRNRIQLHFTKSEIIAPQLKSRAFEAAFSRSLILCRRDPFNIIEKFFEPDKEFIYYEQGSLESSLDEILNSYEDYTDVIERAYKRASSNYRTSDFFDKYLRNAE